jgi:hypothetical protein
VLGVAACTCPTDGNHKDISQINGTASCDPLILFTSHPAISKKSTIALPELTLGLIVMERPLQLNLVHGTSRAILKQGLGKIAEKQKEKQRL